MRNNLIFILIILLTGCSSASYHDVNWKINKEGSTIISRIPPNEGFEFVKYPKDSFEYYVQNLKVKKDGTNIYLYDNSKQLAQGFHVAIIDIDTGSHDLQQCADAIIRIRAEYLFKNKKYNEIAFHLTNGFLFKYEDYKNGYRLKVNNNKTWLEKEDIVDKSYQAFRNYLDVVFTYAGTLSLPLDTKTISINDIKPGDFIVDQGHAVMVVNVAINKDNDKTFLLAQSSTPAQSIHILKNSQSNSPWYYVEDYQYPFVTPTWTFEKETTIRTY